MADAVSVAVILAFFALAALLVRACERIIGPDEVGAVPSTPLAPIGRELAA
jgi:hypothetical protein